MRYPIGERKAIHKYRRDRLQPNDYKIIAALKFRNADMEYIPVKQVVLAKMTDLKQSKVSKTLDRLTARGIVSRFRYGYKEDAIKLLVFNPLWFPNGINVIELPFYG